MTLKEFLLQNYDGDLLEKFKEKFPKMYQYAEQVFLLDWRPEFAVADKNPEAIDEVEFLHLLL